MTKRKIEHIKLALKSQTGLLLNDDRFDYEPLLSSHPDNILKPFSFLRKKMNYPLWVSSMTGGVESAGEINKNLARACNEFGLGMGLGSCRSLLSNNKYEDQFALREIIGKEYPFYANLGISQIEKSITNNSVDRILEMVERLNADGLIIHVNMLQEWIQPEGDRITVPPVDTIKLLLDKVKIPIIVKEVGQGFGPASIKELLNLPIEAIELAAFGGTNFAKLELMRNSSIKRDILEPLSFIGHTAYMMIEHINDFIKSDKSKVKCKSVIISGGIKNFLDGYYLTSKSKLPAIYGQASSFLQYAMQDYESLKEFIQYQISGLELANAFLRIRE